VKLSDRELQVYRLLVEGKNPSEIAAELSLSIKTVSTHRSPIGEKLNAGSLAEMIRYAYDRRALLCWRLDKRIMRPVNWGSK
jgi:DNA-binding NarL/FixJ family response regulator